MNASDVRGRTSPEYQAFDYRFRLEGSLVDVLSPAFAGMRTAGDDMQSRDGATAVRPATRRHVIRVDDTGAGLCLGIDGTTTFRTADLGALLHQAVWEVTQRSIAAVPSSVVLHAAAVAVEQRVIVLSGPSGSGKSTLAAALCERGGTYLTDEALEISPAGAIARGLPRPIHLSRRALEILGWTDRYNGVEMPGGGAYWMPAAHRATAPAWDVLLVQMRGHDGPFVHDVANRADMIAGLVRESFPPATTTAAGLQILKKLSSDSHCLTMGGGSVADRAQLLMYLAVRR